MFLPCPDPDPHKFADPDPGRPKTCGSCGSGSETLAHWKVLLPIGTKHVVYVKLNEMTNSLAWDKIKN